MKDVSELQFPADRRYAPDHEWARQEADLVRVGISDYAQDQLGDIVYAELPAVGARFEQGAEFGTLESVKAVSELYMPLGGEIVAVNTALQAAPQLINQDPYGDGWIAQIRPSDPLEYQALMDLDRYLAMLKGA